MSGERRLRGERVFRQPAWLTDAIRETVHGERGRAKLIQDALGLPYSAVTDLADPNRYMALKAWQIADMTLATGCFAVLDAIERRVGRVAFSAITVTDPDDVLQQALAKEVNAFGESLAEIGADLADGRIDQDELQRILRDIDKLLARTCEFRSMVIDKARLDAAAVAR